MSPTLLLLFSILSLLVFCHVSCEEIIFNWILNWRDIIELKRGSKNFPWMKVEIDGFLSMNMLCWTTLNLHLLFYYTNTTCPLSEWGQFEKTFSDNDTHCWYRHCQYGPIRYTYYQYDWDEIAVITDSDTKKLEVGFTWYHVHEFVYASRRVASLWGPRAALSEPHTLISGQATWCVSTRAMGRTHWLPGPSSKTC